jgi:hypothetical protein
LIAYNEAQKVEVKLFDELLKDLVVAMPEPEQIIGSYACQFMSLYSVPFRKCTLSYLAVAHIVYFRMQLKKDKKKTHRISVHHQNSSTI